MPRLPSQNDQASQRQWREGKPSTIEDVARLAGVSTATVSRFFNQPDLVAKKSRVRVAAAVKELRYIPNELAGSLASSMRRTVAILVPSLADSIAEPTIERLVQRLSDAGGVALIGITGMSAERTEAAITAALRRRVSAIVTTGVIEPSIRHLLEGSDTSVIEIWGLPPDPVDLAIGFSHVEVGRALASFVHERGYQRPHLVTATGTRAARRREGFIQRWQELNHQHPTEDMVPIPTGYEHAGPILENIRKLKLRPDVVITGSDIVAHGLCLAASRIGWRVPEDLGVVGFGDLDFAAYIDPPLTTVRINGEKIADEVMKALDDRAAGINPMVRRVNCGFDIIARISC